MSFLRTTSMSNKARSRVPLDFKGDMNVRWMTTGQVAKYFGVAPGTVTKWIDSGMIAGMRLPGSKDRRVHPAAVHEFEERMGFAKARGKKMG